MGGRWSAQLFHFVHRSRALSGRSVRERQRAGGACTVLNSWVKSSLQGQRSGRCRVRRRAERARRAGTLIRRSRMVAVVALAWNAEARAPAARAIPDYLINR